MKPLSWMLAFFLLLPSPGWAQATWSDVGPFGGWINDLVEDSSGRILAATSFGGIYRSSDNAESWQQIFNQPTVFDPRAIATNSSGHLFVGSEGLNGVGFLRSTDDGATWQVVANALSSRGITDLLVTATQAIYACTFSHGLYRSTDNGTTFTPVSGLPASFTTRIETNASGHLFVGVQFETGNLYRSTDNGATWQRADTGIASDVTDVHVSGSALYAVAGLAVYRSNDDGVTWTNLQAPGGGGFRGVTVDSGGNIYVSVPEIGTGDAVYRSTNGGTTWTRDTGLPGSAVLRLLQTSAAGLFCGTAGKGVYRRDGSGSASAAGLDWTQKINGMANTWITGVADDPISGNVYASTRNSGVFRSTDAGTTWQSASAGIAYDRQIVSIAVNSDGTVFAGGLTPVPGLYRSTDQGATWTGVHVDAATAVACNSQGHVFTGFGSRMFRSTDNGATWTSAILSGVQNIADIAFDGTTVYVATGVSGGFGSKGVYRSTDNGTTWSAFNDGLTDLNVTTIAVGQSTGPLGGGTCRITLGTRGSGAFNLNEGLATWEQHPTVGPGRVVIDMIKPSFAGNDEELLAELNRLWEIREICDWAGVPEPPGLRSDISRLQSLLDDDIHQNGAARVPGIVRCVGTVGHGILRRGPSSPTGVPPQGPVAGIVLGPNSPNPFHRSTLIEFGLATQERVDLRVYDASGREVATLVNDVRSPGRHEVHWNAAGLASGVYFARLSTKGGVQTRRLALLR